MAGVNDTHGHAGLNGVVQEDRVNGFANRVVATERERHVRNAAGNMGVWQMRFDPAHRFDKVDGIAIVLGNTGGNGEDIRIEDDVFSWEAIGHKELVSPFADFGFAGKGVGLTFFVKRHDDDRSAVLTRQTRLTQELGFAFFHRD